MSCIQIGKIFFFFLLGVCLSSSGASYSCPRILEKFIRTDIPVAIRPLLLSVGDPLAEHWKTGFASASAGSRRAVGRQVVESAKSDSYLSKLKAKWRQGENSLSVQTTKLSEPEKNHRREEVIWFLDLVAAQGNSRMLPVVAEELTERMARHWTAQGVQFDLSYSYLHGQYRLDVSKEGRHPMEQRAAELFENLAVKSLYYGIGGADGRVAGFDKENLEIAIGHEDALLLTGKTVPLSHERRHAFNLSDPKRNLGESIVGTSELPSHLSDGYKKFQSHDEMDAYYYSTKQVLDLLRQKRTGDSTALGERLEKTIRYGLEASRRNITIANEALNTIDGDWMLFYKKYPSSRGTISFNLDKQGKVQATLGVASGSEGFYETTIPLAGATQVKDRKNLDLLRTEVLQMRERAQNHSAQFEMAAHAYDKLVGQVPNSRPWRVVLEALRGSVRPWTGDKIEPITTGDAFTRFNELIQFHDQRTRD